MRGLPPSTPAGSIRPHVTAPSVARKCTSSRHRKRVWSPHHTLTRRERPKSRKTSHNGHEVDSLAKATESLDRRTSRLGHSLGTSRCLVVVPCSAVHFLNLKLDQTVTQRAMPSDPSKVLLGIDVHATNIGKVRIDLGEKAGRLQVCRVFSEPDHQLVSSCDDKNGLIFSKDLSSLLLQPGESDQVGVYLLPVDKSLSSVRISSYYQAPDTRQYWTLESLFDLAPPRREITPATQSPEAGH